MATMPGKHQNIVVAINPSASFGRNRDLGPLVVATLEQAGHYVTALSFPTFTELLAASRAAVALGPDAFVIVGGDGMVNLGANVLAETGVPLGIVPAGTGNDMARALGIPHDNTDAAITALLASLGRPAIEIDAGRIRHRDDATGDERITWFACMISAGFDARVNERANQMSRPRGASRYIIAMLVELVKLVPIAYRLELDGELLETEGSLISIGNGVSLGGGMKVTPDAMLDDGQFDVMIVQPMSRVSFMRIFPRVFKGTHITDPRVAIHRASRVTLDSSGVTAYADGERVGLLPIDVEVVPGALSVLVPEPSYDSPIVIAK